MVYPTLLPLMRTPRLPVVDWTDVLADLNGLVRFAERRNPVSAHVPSRFKRSLLPQSLHIWTQVQHIWIVIPFRGCSNIPCYCVSAERSLPGTETWKTEIAHPHLLPPARTHFKGRNPEACGFAKHLPPSPLTKTFCSVTNVDTQIIPFCALYPTFVRDIQSVLKAALSRWYVTEKRSSK